VTGCASIPGKTPTEQIASLEKLHVETLDQLYREHPEAREQIKKSAGYVIMDNSVVKIPMFGAGSGYGIAINRIKKTQSYVKMLRLDIGWGGGARHVRPVLIMYDQKEFESFVKGKWIFNSGGEASAKAGDTGSAGRASSDKLETEKTYDFYLLTEAGVSATFTAAVIHVRDVKIEE
jgi:lipid-binding SYLF domain-containing protein